MTLARGAHVAARQQTMRREKIKKKKYILAVRRRAYCMAQATGVSAHYAYPSIHPASQPACQPASELTKRRKSVGLPSLCLCSFHRHKLNPSGETASWIGTDKEWWKGRERARERKKQGGKGWERKKAGVRNEDGRRGERDEASRPGGGPEDWRRKGVGGCSSPLHSLPPPTNCAALNAFIISDYSGVIFFFFLIQDASRLQPWILRGSHVRSQDRLLRTVT